MGSFNFGTVSRTLRLAAGSIMASLTQNLGLLVGLMSLALVSCSPSAHKVCYEPYGCFTADAPFDEALVLLPENPKRLNTEFKLYTRRNPSMGQGLDPVAPQFINDTTFDGARKTVFYLHDFMGDGEEFWIKPMRAELLKRDDFNVIFVDWNKAATLPYHQAVGNTRLIGAQTSLLMEGMLKMHPDMKLADVHCIGFGLGAHICGYAGRNLARKNMTLGRISGLDPSAPYFEFKHVDVRLDPTDASFVDVIHTDTETIKVKGVGTKQPLGHLDFYPNGATFQPGCLTLEDGIKQLVVCSHYRAVRYFMESLNKGSCPFRTYPCKNYHEFATGFCARCPPQGCPLLGYDSVNHKGKIQGSFYMQTNTKGPYCTFHYNIKFHTGSKIFADLNGPVEVIITGEKGTSEVIKVPKHYYRSGSVDQFLVHTRKDLGKLVKVRVQHKALVDAWYLYAVVIRPLWNEELYTGCYQRWMNNPDNEVDLKTGPAAHCPE